MPVQKLLEETAASLGTIAAALMAVVWGGTKAFSKFKSEKADAAVSDLRGEKAIAETDVITLLRAEVTRLAEENSRLIETVKQLHEEVQKLAAKNAHLEQRLECMQNVNCQAPRTN